MRTNRSTGKVRQVAATVVAANAEGVVFRTVDGNEALPAPGCRSNSPSARSRASSSPRRPCPSGWQPALPASARSA